MKFIFFNIIIIVALGYLITSDTVTTGELEKNFPSSSDTVKKITSAVKSVKSRLVDNRTEAIKNEGAPAPVGEDKIELSADYKRDVQKKVQDFFSLLNNGKETHPEKGDKFAFQNKDKEFMSSIKERLEMQEDEALENSGDKEPIRVSQRSVHPTPHYKKSLEVNSIQKQGDKADGINNSISQNQFMTPAERRRELNRLARDMEMVFIKKLNM